MSKAQVRHLSGSGVERGIDDLIGILPRLATRSIDQYVDLLQRGSRLVSGMMPKQLFSMPGCCDVPEQECPPHCVCQIDWEACPGENVQATIRVTNTSSQARNFTFQATPLQGGSGTAGALDVAPASAQLAAGQSATLTASIKVGESAKPGEQYASEVWIRGAYEQCVIVRLKVCTGSTVHCEVQQGDPPVRIRAHRWYDHFQCEEPCAQPQRTPQQPNPPGKVP